ncbi:hypothetical protein BLA60_18850 [Actinophytocola xinjiangensis]|uniref:CBS domain-containing protein n=1 Tax=Actinophytocola xinjiangensis TaxID=485602 RepID=A0A7Z0WL27_9PSEU|nr:CBS domain-containing protein [Actinophytocola xinjiangensis]OLF09826.1 hypothetical protein BLA60_18850 [Actinophytocola xinjiangensis]
MVRPVAEETPTDPGARTMHLIGGRRVTVSDLQAAGLLPAGTRLRFDRKRIGTSFEATVTDQGRIRLDAGGEEFRSPSRAAAVAAGMRAVDGWRAWQLAGQDRLLDSVRQDFLDQAIATVAADRRNATRQCVHERLRRARGNADGGTPERVSVRDLLALWGAADRGEQVGRIEADLANHGLVTSPNFRAVTLDTVVALSTPPDDEAATAEPATAEDRPVTGDDEGDTDLDVRLTVGNLSPLRGVESVAPNSTLDEAVTKMQLNDYSQLAVLNGPRNLRGAVTWRSIALVARQRSAGTVAEAIDPHVELVTYDRDLVEVLPLLRQREFVFVADESRSIAGIVTTADVARHFGVLATPFFQLGEIDQTLRWVLGRAMDIGTVRRLCTRAVRGFDDLTLGDYQRILENKEAWDALGWPLDRPSFIARLDEIRLIRNKVMHFHPDPMPENVVDTLRRFTNLLHHYREPA